MRARAFANSRRSEELRQQRQRCSCPPRTAPRGTPRTRAPVDHDASAACAAFMRERESDQLVDEVAALMLQEREARMGRARSRAKFWLGVMITMLAQVVMTSALGADIPSKVSAVLLVIATCMFRHARQRVPALPVARLR